MVPSCTSETNVCNFDANEESIGRARVYVWGSPLTWELCAPSAAQTRRMRSSALATTPRSSPAHPPKAFRVETNGLLSVAPVDSRVNSGPDMVYVFPVPV